MIFRSKHLGMTLSTKEVILVYLETRSNNKAKANILAFKVKTIPMSGEVFQDGSLARQQPLSQELAEFVKENGLKGVPVNIGLNTRQAVIRSLRLPAMPPQEITKALEWEATRYLALPKQEIVFDYLQLGSHQEEGVVSQELLLVAAKNSVLSDLCLLVKEAGLKARAIDVEPMAFLYLRTYGQSLGKWPALEERWASIELGDNKTLVAFYQRDLLQFVHTIPLVFDINTQVGEDIIREVRRSFDYYHLNQKRPLTEAVYLWGEKSSLALPYFQGSLLANTIHLPLASLWGDLTKSADYQNDKNSLPLGLALREVV